MYGNGSDGEYQTAECFRKHALPEFFHLRFLQDITPPVQNVTNQISDRPCDWTLDEHPRSTSFFSHEFFFKKCLVAGNVHVLIPDSDHLTEISGTIKSP